MFQIVLCTCPNNQVAHQLASRLVEDKLAACVNIISGVKSIYRWQGKIETDDEVQLVIKSKKQLFNPLADKINLLHPYDVTEVIALDIQQGNQAYLTWLEDSLINDEK